MFGRRPISVPPEDWPGLMAHRGLAALAPENTLASFGVALELRFDLEFDVLRTADGELVVIHDKTVDRTTDGTGSVDQLTLREIRRLDAGGWFDTAYMGERIPTLGETLAFIEQRQHRATTIAINLKTIEGGVEELIITEVQRMKMIDQVFCYAMDEESNARFKRVSGGIRTGISTRGFCNCDLAGRDDWMRAVRFGGVEILWVNFVPAAELVREAQNRGKQVWVRQTNGFDLRLFMTAVNNGVDGICSDDVIEMRSHLQTRGKGRRS